MTILARTADYLVEFECGYLTIVRYSDGHCKAWKRSGIAGEFRDALKYRPASQVIGVYLKMMRNAEWEPLYKPHRIPGADADWDAATDTVVPPVAA